MEITHSHLLGIVLVVYGLWILVKGEVSFEFGITNGARKSEFIYSKFSKLQGTAARVVGLAISAAGVCIPIFIPSSQILMRL